MKDSFQGKQHCRTGSVVDVAVKLPGSAPGKLLSSKFKVQTSKPVEGEIGENFGVEEAIPAATYIPRDDDLIDDSDSSTDFEKEVNIVLGTENDHNANKQESHWIASCELNSVQKSPDPFLLESILTNHDSAEVSSKENQTPMTNTTNISSIQPVQQPELESATYQEDPGHVSSLVSPSPVVLGEEQEVLPHDSLNKTECRLGTKTVNLKLLHNPCEEIKKTREERRTSDRQMLNLLKTENDAPLKKRSFEEQDSGRWQSTSGVCLQGPGPRTPTTDLPSGTSG
ncbi:hypothetical protein PVAP13_5KG678507 [Panicum virgatum]|uniref:Uncharacterized protein n=1 Tax=Panicum virgatum TaxID=38727 RepID=A0A8T0T264_PANVG|nr:hypothetical protein PVAP13_5KG678507 [Panicum virgatum]